MSQMPEQIHEKDLRRFWSTYFGINVVLCVIAIILMLVNLYEIYQVKSERITNAAQLVIALDDELTEIELTEILGRVEAAEGRAQNYLGIFEAIAFGVSVFSILLVGIGFAAAAIGVSNFNELRKQLEDARKEVQKTEQDLTESINLKLENLEANSVTAIQKRVEKQISENIDQHLLSNLTKNRQASTLISIAERDLRQNNLKSALITFERACELDGDNPLPHYYLGYIALQASQNERARAYFEKTIKIDSEFHHAIAALGFTYRRIGEIIDNAPERQDMFDRAEAFLRRALGMDSNLVDFEGESWHGSLAGLYRRTGQIEKAKYHYTLAEEVTPLSSYPSGNLARLEIISGSKNINERYLKVRRLAQLEISINIGNYWAWADLLTAYLVLGENDDARSTLDNLLDAIPDMIVDVLPRVVETLNDILNAPAYDNDLRDRVTIEVIVRQLNEKTESDLAAASE